MGIRLIGDDRYCNLEWNGDYIAAITACEEGYKVELYYDGANGVFADRDDAVQAAIEHTEKVYEKNAREADAVLRPEPGFFGSIKKFLGF